jgi:hypothetical protein
MKMRRFLSLLVLLSGILGASSAKAQSNPPATGGLLVKVHVFSGRRDPEFRITDPAEIAKIMAILNANAAEDTKPASPEVITHKLGYRGIEIIPEPGLAGLGNISTFAVNNNRIQVHRKVNGVSKATLHNDVAAELEGYLLERGLAQGHLESKVVQRVHTQH